MSSLTCDSAVFISATQQDLGNSLCVSASACVCQWVHVFMSLTVHNSGGRPVLCVHNRWNFIARVLEVITRRRNNTSKNTAASLF